MNFLDDVYDAFNHADFQEDIGRGFNEFLASGFDGGHFSGHGGGDGNGGRDGIEEGDIANESVQNIIYQDSLKWVFVGGKGGCGKTTVSCGLAIQLAYARESVLILSTDPAHNLSDAFGQQFTKEPTKVEGFVNLFAMEVNNDEARDENETLFGFDDESDTVRLGNSIIKTIASAFPGIDETLNYAQILKSVQSMNFSVIVFDTAATGHTLKLLTFPLTMEKTLKKILDFKNTLAPYLNQICTLFGSGVNIDDITQKIEELLAVIKTFNQQLKNPEKTTFVCVCIAEFLSVYETERLFQELSKNEIDIHNIVVNQLNMNNGESSPNCTKCSSRKKLQDTYLEQINDLYFGLQITKVPLIEKDIRGVPDLIEFSRYLLSSFYAFRNTE